MTIFKILPLIAAVVLTACSSSDSYSNYLGHWESREVGQFSGKEILKVAQISKDGESYLFEGNILSDKSKPILLTENDGKLTANTGMGTIDLGLSDDKNTLYAANKTYTKIDETLANQYKQDKEDCKLIWGNYKDEIREKDVHLAILSDEKTAIKESIQAKYKTELDRLQPECGMPF